MKRTVFIMLGCLGLGLAIGATRASADDGFNCYKAKATFAGSTVATIDDEFGSRSAVAVKKPFLYCSGATFDQSAPSGAKMNCYKVKGPAGTDSSVSDTDAFGSLTLAVKSKKIFLLCVPAT